MAKKHVNIGDREINYTVEGKGKRVILLHGFGEDSRVWKYQYDQLVKSCQLIVPDLPGSGESDMVGDMSIEAMAEAIHVILENETDAKPGNLPFEDSCIVLGHSMGGYITLAFVEKYPSVAAAFGLIHSTASPDNDEKKAARRKSIEFIRTHGSKAFLEQSTPNLFAENYRIENPEVIKAMIEQYADFNPASLIAYYEAMIKRPDRTRILKSYSKPVLFILGKLDTAIPFDQVIKQTHLPSVSDITILEHSGHMGMWEEAEKTTEAILRFLQTAKTT